MVCFDFSKSAKNIARNLYGRVFVQDIRKVVFYIRRFGVKNAARGVSKKIKDELFGGLKKFYARRLEADATDAKTYGAKGMLNFLGIGAQKAGTSWLYSNLSRHPIISFPAGKEVHFWDQQYARGVTWYKSLFDGEPKKLKGEITPAYAILDRGVIEQIYAINEDLKLIYIIRNPIERTWSSALMALGRAEMSVEEASDQWFIDHFLSSGSLRRGDYEKCIRTWRSVFPVDQLLILRFEEIKKTPKAMLKKCCQHLGIDGSVYDRIDEATLGKAVFKGIDYKIRPSLLPVLIDLYKKKILSLSEYLQEDFSEWIDKYR